MTFSEKLKARQANIEAIGNALTFLEALGYRDGGDIHDDLQKCWEEISGKKWVVTQPDPPMPDPPAVIPAWLSRCPDCDQELRLATSGHAWFCPGCEARYTRSE